MIPFNLIVAVDRKYGIGKGGAIPWHLPGDLRRFKEITTATQSPGKSNLVIMGRKTWESLPEKFKPLPGRINLVLSRQTDLVLPQDVLLADSFAAIFGLLEGELKDKVEQAFVIGGAEIYREAIQNLPCFKLFVTQVLQDFSCDTFFPLPITMFEKIGETPVLSEKGVDYRFVQCLRP